MFSDHVMKLRGVATQLPPANAPGVAGSTRSAQRRHPVRWPNALSGHVTGFCREIRGFLTWPWSICPSEVATEERRICSENLSPRRRPWRAGKDGQAMSTDDCPRFPLRPLRAPREPSSPFCPRLAAVRRQSAMAVLANKRPEQGVVSAYDRPCPSLAAGARQSKRCSWRTRALFVRRWPARGSCPTAARPAPR